MIPPTRALSLLTVLAYTSTCLADVWVTGPIADTHWKVGSPAEIRWRLTSPTSKQDVATVYLVGGDYTAYKRLETLGKDVVLGHHKLVIPKVPTADCGSSCAIEFVIKDGPGKGDYYSQSLILSTLSVSGSASSTSATTSASGGKSPSGSTCTSAAQNGPVAMVQNSGKGAQESTSNSGGHVERGTMALVITTASGAAAVAMSFFL
ncbi:MAG: hypothetical protein J3Q66DRAFT_410538 [Benniella sp.]|nr:MAG: hypothetical protein J3Q66DRAFT_410538 [Benniella sp.]